jgi:hypothetical protein
MSYYTEERQGHVKPAAVNPDIFAAPYHTTIVAAGVGGITSDVVPRTENRGVIKVFGKLQGGSGSSTTSLTLRVRDQDDNFLGEVAACNTTLSSNGYYLFEGEFMFANGKYMAKLYAEYYTSGGSLTTSGDNHAFGTLSFSPGATGDGLKIQMIVAGNGSTTIGNHELSIAAL